MRHNWTELGREMATTGWGFDNELSSNDVIAKAPNDSRIVYLLSALVRETIGLRADLKARDRRKESRPPKPDEPSDGMLDAFRMHSGNVKVRECPEWHTMSVRGRKALNQAGIKFVQEITQERLTGIRHCGQTTINELLHFKFKKLYPTNESNDQ